jgi:pSer/pThr/pTyr-binding forkhead associated (FHA) protein
MWILQSSDADAGAWTFRLRPGATKTVGRATRADFILDAALVSRLHCQLTAGDEALEVVDLRSRNGTFVNDRRVNTARLASGDRLRIGRIELTVGRA